MKTTPKPNATKKRSGELVGPPPPPPPLPDELADAALEVVVEGVCERVEATALDALRLRLVKLADAVEDSVDDILSDHEVICAVKIDVGVLTGGV